MGGRTDRGQRDALQDAGPGGDRKPREVERACGVQCPAHSFAVIRDPKVYSTREGRLPPPSSTVLGSEGLSTFDLSLQIIFPTSAHMFAKGKLLSLP